MRSIYSSHIAIPRHIPQRTCVACRKVIAKRELMRLVRTTDGAVEIDSSGKKAGRGAYLCPTIECWEKALKGNQLEHALRGTLTQSTRQLLIEQAKDLLEGANRCQG